MLYVLASPIVKQFNNLKIVRVSSFGLTVNQTPDDQQLLAFHKSEIIRNRCYEAFAVA